MAESIGNSGKGMKLHTKILIGLGVGAVLGIVANQTLGADHPFVRGVNTYLAGLANAQGLTEAEVRASRGFANTMKAYHFFLLAIRSGPTGIPIDVDRPITAEDVQTLVAEAVPGSTWAFLDAIGSRRTADAATLAARLPAYRSAIRGLAAAYARLPEAGSNPMLHELRLHRPRRLPDVDALLIPELLEDLDHRPRLEDGLRQERPDSRHVALHPDRRRRQPDQDAD